MQFNTMTFIYVFLPVVLFLYLVSKKELRNSILLFASIVFFACLDIKCLAIMLLTIIVNYYGALVIESNPAKKKTVLFLTLFANLGCLVSFKYCNFFVDNSNLLLHTNFETFKFVVPFGISIYTLQAISYVVDVYREKCNAQKDIYKLALYISMFPQLVGGPIIKYHDFENQFEEKGIKLSAVTPVKSKSNGGLIVSTPLLMGSNAQNVVSDNTIYRDVNFENVTLGVKRFIIGLAKVVLLAGAMATVTGKIFVQDVHNLSHLVAWIGMFAAGLQFYFKFAGIADMAIGLGLIFGFKFMENFNYPYVAKSISEFWERWNISLTTWFKEYFYEPICGENASVTKRLYVVATSLALIGFWYGAKWTFLIWGVWNALFVVAEKKFNFAEIVQKNSNKGLNILFHVYCLLVLGFGWIIFKSGSTNYAIDYILNMFMILPVKSEDILYTVPYYLDIYHFIMFVMAIVCSTPLLKNVLKTDTMSKKIGVNIGLLLLFALSTITIVASL